MRQRLPENRIYEVALKQFAQYGYKKATLEDIAAELNMTGASLYSYASSKQDLYHDCVGYGMKNWEAFVAESLENIEDIEKYFMTLCSSSIEYLKANPLFGTILKRDPEILTLFPETDPYQEIKKDAYLFIGNALKRGVDSGMLGNIDADKCTKLFFALYKNVLIDGYVRDDAEEAMANLPDLLHIILYGLVKR